MSGQWFYLHGWRNKREKERLEIKKMQNSNLSITGRTYTIVYV